MRQAPWVWVFGWSLADDGEVAEIREVLLEAAGAGFAAAVFTFGLDRLTRQTPEYFTRLRAVRALCQQLQLEFIPSVFSLGRADWLLDQDPHLAEGLPVRNAPFRAEQGRARLQTSTLQIQPGWVNLQPRRCYRLEVQARADKVEAGATFRLVVSHGARKLPQRKFPAPGPDWQTYSMVFNSLDYSRVHLQAGLWNSPGGQLELTDWRLTEVGPINLLRRPGTPVRVRGRQDYQEGRDYRFVPEQMLNLRMDRLQPLELELLPGGRIRDGEQLLVDWYHPVLVNEDQMCMCLAQAELYPMMQRELDILARELQPERVFLANDEVRLGGNCESCRGLDLGQLLAGCINRQAELIRSALPQAEVIIWSDMLDPGHNGHGDYYLCEGSFAQTARHVNRELRVAVWGREARPESLAHFDRLGFSTLVACFYDARDLSEVENWRRAAGSDRPFMYTAWSKDYTHLKSFSAVLGIKS
ncbi:MAG: hypothetical protein U0931_38670 [Vulcanimicrobiota bacterium]